MTRGYSGKIRVFPNRSPTYDLSITSSDDPSPVAGALTVSKNESICDCAGARPQIEREALFSNSLLMLINVFNRSLFPPKVRDCLA